MVSAIEAYSNGYTSSGGEMLDTIVYLAIIVGFWMVFNKVGMKGWYSLIPVYNYYKLFEATVGGGGIFILVSFLPVVRDILLRYYTAKAFGKDNLFMIGLMVIPCVFYPVLGFGDSTYYGPLGMGDTRTQKARTARTVDFDVVKNNTSGTSGNAYQGTPEPKEEDVDFDVVKEDDITE